jgi:hypothetical protein
MAGTTAFLLKHNSGMNKYKSQDIKMLAHGSSSILTQVKITIWSHVVHIGLLQEKQ